MCLQNLPKLNHPIHVRQTLYSYKATSRHANPGEPSAREFVQRNAVSSITFKSLIQPGHRVISTTHPVRLPRTHIPSHRSLTIVRVFNVDADEFHTTKRRRHIKRAETRAIRGRRRTYRNVTSLGRRLYDTSSEATWPAHLPPCSVFHVPTPSAACKW